MNITLPMDNEAEMYVIGSCINSINALNHVMATLDMDDFFSTDLREIFISLKALYVKDSQVTVESLSYELSKGSSKITIAKLVEISFSAWNGIDYESFAEIVKEKSSLRKIIMSAQQAIFDAAQPNAKSAQVISECQSKFLICQGITTKNSVSYKEKVHDFRRDLNIHDYYLWIEQRKQDKLPIYEGVLTGYPTLDHTLGSFQNGALYYIGARTSMGKTTFLCNLVRQMMHKYKIGIFSLETGAVSLVLKLACMVADIKSSDYEDGKLTPENVERLKTVIKSSLSSNIIIEDPSAISLIKLASRAKRMRNQGTQVIFIDYLTRIKADGKHANKHLMVDEVSKGLQTLAKELEIPIICFAQLNRAAAGGSSPTLVDFRESGSIEEDADACLFLHRPSYYCPTDFPGVTQVIIAKNRLRGILTRIDFHCNFKQSEVYHELLPIKEEIEKINNAFARFEPKED